MDYEFRKLGLDIKTTDICLVTDTLQMARQMYPGKRNSLDALCDRLGIDNSKRTLHGALLDAEILADVYLSMTGGQTSLFDEEHADSSIIQAGPNMQDLQSAVNFSPNLKVLQPNDDELQAHLDFLKLVNKKAMANVFGLFVRVTKPHINRLSINQINIKKKKRLTVLTFIIIIPST